MPENTAPREFVVIVNDDDEAMICDLDEKGWGNPIPTAILFSLVGDSDHIILSDPVGKYLGIVSAATWGVLGKLEQVFLGTLGEGGYYSLAQAGVRWV